MSVRHKLPKYAGRPILGLFQPYTPTKFLVYVRKHPKPLGNFLFLCIAQESFVFWPSKGPKNPKNVKKAKNEMFYMSPMSIKATTNHPKYHFLLGIWYSQSIHEVFT